MEKRSLTALSRQQGKVIAVSTIMSGMLQAPLPPERLPLHEVISIWDIAKGAATRADHPLPRRGSPRRACPGRLPGVRRAGG